jgi:acetyl-CoA carboxylase carboxyl transferase beta subunit
MSKMDVVDIFKKRTRSPHRPRSSDVIRSIFPHFRQHPPYQGSLILGETDQWDRRLFIVAQQKPKPEDLRTARDLKKLNYGMLTADEHAHVLRFLNEMAARHPEDGFLISLVDTYGADISMDSARHFQAFFIAHLIRAYMDLPTPSASVVLGEGGSGGALAMQYTDRRAQMDDALYATAPPESMAAIIFRDPTRIRDALAILRPTAEDLLELGVIDHIIPSAKDLTDTESFARPIAAYLERSVKELSKMKIGRLIEERRARAEAYGLPAKVRGIRKIFPLTPLKKKTEQAPPPDIKIFTVEDTALQVRYDYGDGLAGRPGEEYVRCGDTTPTDEEGCGAVIPLKEYLENFNVCPHCGRTRVMGALSWINCLTDTDTFHELYRDLTPQELLPASHMTQEYSKFVAKQARRTHFREALVTGEAEIFGHKVIMAVCEFYFSGGTMGVVFGEKFNRAIDYAIEKQQPFISLCCSGGARLYEGILALMMMAKTSASVEKLKQHGLPYLSVLGDPATGGALASFAALGDVILAEPEAMVIFSGPRVMKSRGFEVDEEAIRARSLSKLSGEIFEKRDYYQTVRGIHEVCERKDMKRVLCKYLEFYQSCRPTTPRK